MSYTRIIPRDLFNEANLLKCYGRLYICLENYFGGPVKLAEDVNHFEVIQRPADGWTYIANIPLTIRGSKFLLTRPLNARDPWPLYAEEIDNPDAEPIRIFDNNGELSQEFLDYVN